jgi:hypothetical protein
MLFFRLLVVLVSVPFYLFFCILAVLLVFFIIVMFCQFSEPHYVYFFLFTHHFCVPLFQESVEATAEVSQTFDEKIRKYCDVTLMSLAYAGTGNVLKVPCLEKYKLFKTVKIVMYNA